jgi:hypothetical protein
MLDQLLNIVKQFGQDTVVNNPDVPNDQNQEVMADATHTIAGGIKNLVAGGGLQNILDLFKGGGASSSGASNGGGIGGLLKNPIVTMMIGHFITKLVGKYKMSPSSASNVANSLIPNSLNSLIEKTKDPNDPSLNLDGLINSIIGGGGSETQPAQASTGGGPLQNLIENFTGGGGGNSNAGGGGGFNLQDLIGKFTQQSQDNLAGGQGTGGGMMDMIKGFFK